MLGRLGRCDAERDPHGLLRFLRLQAKQGGVQAPVGHAVGRRVGGRGRGGGGGGGFACSAAGWRPPVRPQQPCARAAR